MVKPIPNFDAERLQIILQALPIAISWARLEDAHILFANRKFTELFGYDINDFSTVPEWVDKTYVDAKQRKRAEQMWYKYFESPTEKEYEVGTVEVDVLCKNGSIITTLHSGIILPEAGWALATFTDISERKRNEQLTKQLAEQDDLTKVKNRRAFEAHLKRSIDNAINENKCVYLLILDLDHFKQINDTCGHQVGDTVLVEAAKRLGSCVRSSDVLARFGGDEFGLILGNADTDKNVDLICEKIFASMAQPFVCNGTPLTIGISIGIARAPEDAYDAQGLFRAADQALYKSKHGGRNTWTHASSTAV